MAHWEQAWWQPAELSAVPRRDRRAGDYRRYVPDRLEDHPFTLGRELSLHVAKVERDIRALNSGPSGDSLTAIARFLLRSEAIASSRIEGVAPSAQQVALAELATTEDVRGVSDQAKLVANNMTVVRQATSELADADRVTVEHVVRLHEALLPDEPRHHGMRAVQNWIGGSAWHPVDADFVPPPGERVAPLMADLVDYIDGAAHSPLVQAAVVHAQFETIHPFTDGNGRVGRALIHTVLTGRGLTSAAVLPVSLVLATLRATYVEGLTSYRYEGLPTSAAATAGFRSWIATFVEAARLAVEQAARLSTEIAGLRDVWRARIMDHRQQQGIRGVPRSDSATARLLDLLPEAPVVTTRTVQRILGISHPAASGALEELKESGIMTTPAGSAKRHRLPGHRGARSRDRHRTETGQHTVRHSEIRSRATGSGVALKHRAASDPPSVPARISK